MNKVNMEIPKLEKIKHQIVEILNQLTDIEKTAKQELSKIVTDFPSAEDEFSILEEIELLTVNLRGYGGQIQVSGKIKNAEQAIENLHNLAVFEIPAITEFYFSAGDRYPVMKSYLTNLDYLRLLILEYLEFVED